MGKTKKYCHDCGFRVESSQINTAQRSPNEYRITVFHCPNCSEKKGKDVVMGVQRLSVNENKFYEEVMIKMFEAKK